MPSIIVGAGAIDYRLEPAGPQALDRPPLVFLHEGLGSLELWRHFPDALRAAAGYPTTLVYSRHGYGQSAVVPAPRTAGYMHDEALDVLPRLLAGLGIGTPVLVGHSDGASIAAIYAGAGHSATGLVLIAPHVFVEDRAVTAIGAAADAYRHAGLRARLARYHRDPDATFWGWNRVWLSPGFRTWNIEGYLPSIGCPVLLVQGESDEYGTLAQLDRIERAVTGPVTRIVIPGAGHAPHLDHPTETLAAVARFVNQLGPAMPVDRLT